MRQVGRLLLSAERLVAAYPAQAAATQLRLTQSSSSSPLYLHRVYLLYSIYRFYHMLLTTLLAWSLPTLLYTHILLNPPPSHHFTYNILFYTLRTLSLVLLLLSTLHTFCRIYPAILLSTTLCIIGLYNLNLRQRHKLGHRNNALHAVAPNYINYILQSIQFSTAFNSALPSAHTTSALSSHDDPLPLLCTFNCINWTTHYAAVCAQLRLQEDILKGSLISSYC